MSSEKSKNVNDKIKFVKHFEKCTPYVQSLFEVLRQRTIEACSSDDWGYTDKPDFRIAFKQTICELVPMIRPASVKVILRVDRLYPSSLIGRLSMITVEDVKHHKTGRKWVEFLVISESQVEEAIQLIQNVYNERVKFGYWQE